jgi:hypothetical protein
MRSVRVDTLSMQWNAAPTRLAFVILTIMALVSLAVPGAAAETSVTDLPLEDGGSLRMLYAGLENPRAAVIMLPGGNGMVEIGTDAQSAGWARVSCCARCRCGKRRALQSRS